MCTWPLPLTGRKPMQTYGFPIQTYGKHSRYHNFNSISFRSNFCMLLYISCVGGAPPTHLHCLISGPTVHTVIHGLTTLEGGGQRSHQTGDTPTYCHGTFVRLSSEARLHGPNKTTHTRTLSWDTSTSLIRLKCFC